MSNYPRLTPAQSASLREKIASGDSQPFNEVTAILLENGPTPDAISKYANKYPDRWMQAVTQAAKLTGRFDKDSPHTEINIYAKISTMSDAELIVEVENMFNKMGMKAPSVQDLLGLAREDTPTGLTIDQERTPD